MSDGHEGFQWCDQCGDAASLEVVTVQLNGEYAKRHEPHSYEQGQMLELFHRRFSAENRERNFEALADRNDPPQGFFKTTVFFAKECDQEVPVSPLGFEWQYGFQSAYSTNVI